MFGRWKRRLKPDDVPRVHIGPVHTLSSNFDLPAEAYARCVEWVGRIQRIYDTAADYIRDRGLDPDLFYPGNEWATLVPRSGMIFRTGYSDINYLRWLAPFAGYHLPILDRLDVRQFPDDWGADFVAQIGGGIPEDIVEIAARRLPARDRLLPLVPQYEDHIRRVPARYVVTPPRMFGEIGIDVNAALVNADVILSQSRINGMLCSGILDKLDRDIAQRGRARVLEIGPGWGAMAYALKAIFGDRLEYIGIDLPSSLYFSTIYLGATSHWNGCHLLMPEDDKVPERFAFLFVPNYMSGEVAADLGPIDLAFNCMSFPEMSGDQVRFYAKFLQGILRDDGVVFDENAANRPHHCDCKAIFSEIFPCRRAAASSVITTKNAHQDVWSSRNVAGIFDRQDAMYQRPAFAVDR